MRKLFQPLVSLALVIVYIYAMETGRYLMAGLAMSANGLIMLLTEPSLRKRLLAILMMTVGVYLIVMALGLLVSAASTLSRQAALWLGFGVLTAGVQILRYLPKRRALALLLIALGGLLVAYGLGYLG